MSIAPATPTGETAVMEVDEFTVKLAAGIVAKSTALALLKWVPEMLTLVPPDSGPDPGVTAFTLGAGPAQACRAGADALAVPPPPTIPTSMTTAIIRAIK